MAGAAETLARELFELRRRLSAVERGPQLAHSTIPGPDGHPLRLTEGVRAGMAAGEQAAEAIEKASSAIAKADGAVVSFFGDAAPVGMKEGDLWRKSSGEVLTYDGSEWQAIADPAVRDDLDAALDRLAATEGALDGKISTFFAPLLDPPVAAAVGDLWFVEGTNHLRRWDGGDWVDARDASIEQALTASEAAEAKARAAADDAAQAAADLVTARDKADAAATRAAEAAAAAEAAEGAAGTSAADVAAAQAAADAAKAEALAAKAASDTAASDAAASAAKAEDARLRAEAAEGSASSASGAAATAQTKADEAAASATSALARAQASETSTADAQAAATAAQTAADTAKAEAAKAGTAAAAADADAAQAAADAAQAVADAKAAADSAAAAQTKATTAASEAAAAAQRATAAEGSASSASGAALAAEQAADASAADAAAALQRAQAAGTDATAAQTAATQAQQAADASAAQASEAGTAAAAADAKAAQAAADAAQAVADAAAAAERASAAQTSADKAAGSAQSASVSASTAQTAADTASSNATKAANDAKAAASSASTASSDAAKAAERAASALASTPNRIANHDFALGLAEWIVTGGAADSTVGRSGTSSLRFDAGTSSSRTGKAPLITVAPGQVWRIAAWSKTTADYNGTSSWGKLRLGTEGGGFIKAATWPTSADWERTVFEYTVPADGTVTKLEVTLGADHTVGTLWIDDVEAREVSEVKALEAASSAAQKKADEAASAASTAQSKADTAASAAATAQQRADAAHGLAGTAESNAQKAITAAGTAQETADGRPKLLFSTSAPSGNAPQGSTWFRVNSSGQVIGQWQQTATGSGGTWTLREIRSEVIANLDVGKLVAGSATIDSAVARKFIAEVVEAQTITGPTIRTEASGERAEMSKLNGFAAWNAAGEQTVRLGKGDNLLTGRLYTNGPGKPGVILIPVTSTERPGVFFSEDGSASGSQPAIYTDSSWALTLRGKSGADGQAGPIRVKGGLTVESGAVAGGYSSSGTGIATWFIDGGGTGSFANVDCFGGKATAKEFYTAPAGRPGIIMANDANGNPATWYTHDGSRSSDTAAVFTNWEGRLTFRSRNGLPTEFARGSRLSGGVEIWDPPTSTFTANVGIATSPKDRIYKLTSRRSSKVNIRDYPKSHAERLLDVSPRVWFDRTQIEERLGKGVVKPGDGTEGPQVPEALIAAHRMKRKKGDPRLREVPGLVAEEVEAAGLRDYVTYADDPETGEEKVEGVAYDRLWTLLIPLVRSLRDRVAELEARNAELEARVDTLEATVDAQASVIARMEALLAALEAN